MSAFKDDYPPESPAFGDDWSKPIDTRPYESLDEVRSAVREIDELLSGLGRQVIQLPDGRFVTALVQESGSGPAGSILWDLDVVDSDAGTFTIEVGTILKAPTSLTEKITITGAGSTFTGVAGETIRLKVTGLYNAPVVTLETGGNWTDHPAAYETTSSGASAEFAAYYYPLWEFVAVAAADTIRINDNLHARRLAPDSHFMRTYSVYHKTGDRPFAVPLLLPYHHALAV